jgi:uncharacterized repeat protein (TIGR03803 family)
MKPLLFNITLPSIIFICTSVIQIKAQCSEFYWMNSDANGYPSATILKCKGDGTNPSEVLNPVKFEGSFPNAGFCIAGNGKFYGMTPYGGKYSKGVLFEWDPVTNIYNKKLDFNGEENGSTPFGSLFQADNGKLYGMTYEGGADNYGVLFEWDPETDNYTKKHSFNGAVSGCNPSGSLIQAGNGKLYGMTRRGGLHGYGVIFEWDPATNIFSKLLDFNGTGNGAYPHGSLILAANGKLYGMTSRGGEDEGGVLFEWDPATNIFSKILDFIVHGKGAYPYGSLIQAGNGRLYGMTSRGGENEGGVLFEWNLLTKTYTKKLDFQRYDHPVGDLLEVGQSFATFSSINVEECYSLNSPSGKHTWTSSGTYIDTIPNAAGCDSIITFNLTILNSRSRIKVSACDVYITPGGKMLYTSGTYYDTIPNAMGCDSIITLKLTVHHSTVNIINTSTCSDYNFNGRILNTTGTYFRVLPNAMGCDSIIILYLDVRKPTSGTIDVTACNSYVPPSGKYIWNSDGTYLDTIPNTAGCDSVITIHLKIAAIDTSVTRTGTTLSANAAYANYQWLDCSSGYAQLTNATEQSYTPVNNGVFAVEITKDGCVDTSGCHFVSGITGVDHISEASLLWYPNPTNGKLYIELGRTYNNIIVTVKSITGQLLSTVKYGTSARLKIELEGNQGIYLIEINTKEGKRAIFQVVKN